MARDRKLLLRQGKFVLSRALWDQAAGGRITLKTRTYIGESFEVLDLRSATFKHYTVGRLDGQGVTGDAIDNPEADAVLVHVPDDLAGVSLDLALRIGDHMEGGPLVVWDPPVRLDYTKSLATRLRKKQTLEKGELIRVEFFSDATIDPITGAVSYVSDPIIREEYTYQRDAAGFAKSRDLEIFWLRKDGSDHPDSKTMTKVYDQGASIREGKRRRGNVVDQLELVVAGLLIETELANNANDIDATLDMGRELSREYGDEIRDFINVSKRDILTAITADAGFAWLDNLPASLGGAVSIRAAILSTLDIWS